MPYYLKVVYGAKIKKYVVRQPQKINFNQIYSTFLGHEAKEKSIRFEMKDANSKIS